MCAETSDQGEFGNASDRFDIPSDLGRTRLWIAVEAEWLIDEALVLRQCSKFRAVWLHTSADGCHFPFLPPDLHFEAVPFSVQDTKWTAAA